MSYFEHFLQVVTGTPDIQKTETVTELGMLFQGLAEGRIGRTVVAGWAALYTVLCTLYAVLCTLCTVQCTEHTAHCTLHTPHSTLHTAHCTLHIPAVFLTLQLQIASSFPHTGYSSLHTFIPTFVPLCSMCRICAENGPAIVHCTVHTVYLTLHNVLLTLHTSH